MPPAPLNISPSKKVLEKIYAQRLIFGLHGRRDSIYESNLFPKDLLPDGMCHIVHSKFSCRD